MNLAPIILFVYNRPSHTRQTIEALLANPLAKDSDLYIYSDAPKNHEAEEKVSEVRKYIHTITGFKNINIIERRKNFGLSDNIIDGVTTIVNRYEKIIVLEDDIVVSSAFLEYMNHALNYYENQKKVWCINAYCLPTDYKSIGINYFFTREVNCWGWATWKNRWQHYKKDTNWALANFNNKKIKYLNLNSIHNYWEQVVLNHHKKINTWFIFFYLSSINNDAFALSPTTSYVTQIGFDNSGTHCVEQQNFYLNTPYNQLNTNLSFTFPKNIKENKKAIFITERYYFKIKILMAIKKIYRKFLGK